MLIELYRRDLDQHCSEYWGPKTDERIWQGGPALPSECRISIYPPSNKTGCWIYATSGMTPFEEQSLMEIFLMSPCESEGHLELLTAIAHFHQTGALLGPEHTINFGRPWLPQSQCSFGLITHPWTFGPEMEHARLIGKDVELLWLVPITAEEREYKIASGVSSLESLFEQHQFNYLDPLRPSLVSPAS